MKTGWDSRPLAEICGFEGGAQPPKSQFIYEPRSGYIRFLQIRDFGGDKNATFIPESKKNRICCENDIMLARYGASVGKILTGRSGAYNVALMKAIPDLSVISRDWLRYYLTAEDFQVRLLSIASRSAQDGFSKDDIAAFPVPIPPLPEQQRIVGILDEAFAGLATAEANAARNLQNAREIFDSHLHAVFSQSRDGRVEHHPEAAELKKGWEWKTIDQIATNLDSQRVPITKASRVAGKYPYYGASGIVDYVADYIFDGDTLLVSEDGANLLARSTPIAFPASGKYWVNNHAHVLKFENTTTQRFVEYFLESIPLDQYVTGAAQPKLNQRALNSIPIPTPPLPEQQGIVEELDELRLQTGKLGELAEQKQSALAELKKSLLHAAFNGDL